MPVEDSGETGAISLDQAIRSSSREVLKTAAIDPALGEELALALLQRRDLPAEIIEPLSKNAGVMGSRKVKLALVEHPKAPRHISLPLLRHLFTFDLMQVSLQPAVCADIKKFADEVLIGRLESIPCGARLSLARRASGRVAAALLEDRESRVIRAALDNGRLAEASIVKALMRANSRAALVEAVCHHPKWAVRREVRIALLRNQKTPLARALEFARNLPPPLLREVLHSSRLPLGVKSYLAKELEQRVGPSPALPPR